MNLQEQISRIQEIMSIKDMFKGMFGKKELTSDDKRINMIVDLINEFFEIKEKEQIYNSKLMSVIYTDFSNDYVRIVMEYIPKFKRLEYTNDFAKQIYSYIPDERLLEEDSELMGKVFEKLKKRKVDTTQNFTIIRL
jgi:uncharacterized protein YccT (UPF0319 family)